MALNIIDTITSILQSISLGYIIFYCVDEKQKNNKIKLLATILMFIFIVLFFSETLGKYFGTSVLITHILGLFTTMIFYKKNKLSSAVAYTLNYFTICICAIIFNTLIFECVKEIIPIQYIDYEKIFLFYVPQCILVFLNYRCRDKIKQMQDLIINGKFSIFFMIISFSMDFIISFYGITLGYQNQLIKNVLYLIFVIFLGIILVYFWKIHRKSEQIYKLNSALEIKNNELRKIKHDYGAQISYLYGLCLMERFDDLKKALKNIINNNDSTVTAAEVCENQESLLSIALKPAIDKGIHVIIDEKCAFDSIKMNQMEFYRVISNIVNNAIKAMNGNGIIIAKSYEYLGNAVIKIENNGPKIEEHHLKDIFKVGFTTKNNKDNNHGYGLSIVKELVESNNGKIYVKSTDTATEFKIVLPVN